MVCVSGWYDTVRYAVVMVLTTISSVFYDQPATPLQGVEESLAFLRQVWDEQGPFDGLLGFSQGATMASIFYHCAFSRTSKAAGAPDDGSNEHINREAREIC